MGVRDERGPLPAPAKLSLQGLEEMGAPGVWLRLSSPGLLALLSCPGYKSALEAGGRAPQSSRGLDLQSSHSGELVDKGWDYGLRKGFDFLWCQVLGEASKEDDSARKGIALARHQETPFWFLPCQPLCCMTSGKLLALSETQYHLSRTRA